MIRIGIAPRWEDATFDAGGRVAILAADGSLRYATCAAELEPIETGPLSRDERRRIDAIMAGFPRRVA